MSFARVVEELLTCVVLEDKSTVVESSSSRTPRTCLSIVTVSEPDSTQANLPLTVVLVAVSGNA